jgi:hypothetical protein
VFGAKGRTCLSFTQKSLPQIRIGSMVFMKDLQKNATLEDGVECPVHGGKSTLLNFFFNRVLH